MDFDNSNIVEDKWDVVYADDAYALFSNLADQIYGKSTHRVTESYSWMITSFDVWQGIVSGTKNGASGKANKIMKEFEKIVTNLTLTDVIKSCNFKLCGSKVSEQCANYLIGLPYDFSHLASEGYEWCKDKNSKNYKYVMDLINKLGRTLDDFKAVKEESSTASSQIPVILTGEPNNYRTKAEFLKCNPQYRMTTSWKEVKIVFTNSLDSNTGKMKQARAKGIEIQIY